MLRPNTDLCRGCGRSLSEIERWTRFSDAERARIMAALPERLAMLSARPSANARITERSQGPQE
jgi:predicted Fe-S protein YdhL (DUF1289 family)